MRTQLQERHRPLFASLDESQMHLVWDRVVAAWPGDMRKFVGSPPDSPGGLFETFRDAGLDHARVVLSLAREYEPFGRQVIETLVGHPIIPWAESVEARAPAPPVKKTDAVVAKEPDARVVLEVAEANPHREGTGAHKAYQKWRVGATIGELVQKGMPARSVRRDVRHGHVKLGAP